MIFNTAQELQERVINLGFKLTARGLTIATAESCTGGGLGALLSSVPGSSAWFVGGIITYSNALKVRLLDVPQAVLDDAGAISEACAKSMAHGGRRATGAELCISVTGLAGPGGGSDDKAVGTVCFALASASGCSTATQYFGDLGRQQVRTASAEFALRWLENDINKP